MQVPDASYDVLIRIERRDVPFNVQLEENGKRGSVHSRDGLMFTADAVSCTCASFLIDREQCVHMQAFARAYRAFAREHGIPLTQVKKPLWAEDA